MKSYEATNVVNGTLTDEPSEEIRLKFPFVPTRDQTKRDADPHPDSCLDDAELGYASNTFAPLLIAGYTGENGPANGKCDRYNRDRDNSTAAVWINAQDSQYISRAISTIFTQSLETSADSSLGQVLWSANDGNFSKTMENAAMALTNTIRQTSNATTVHGDVISNVIVIRVNWPWLIYPCALVLLMKLFMIATLIFSAEKSNIVWKSSTLAVLFHGLRGWDRHALRANNIPDMEKAARKMSVKLERAEEESFGLMRKV